MWVFTIDGFYSAVQHRDHAESLRAGGNQGDRQKPVTTPRQAA